MHITSGYQKPLSAAQDERKTCLIRWEITNQCDVGCKHCIQAYNTPAGNLSYEDCLGVLASLGDFVSANNFSAKIFFTGGDPLLRTDFLDILKITAGYLRAGTVRAIIIQGNPAHLDETVASRLKENGVSVYALSTEGCEKLHDFFRQPGSFRQTLSAIRCLRQAGIQVPVRLTVSRINDGQVVEVIQTMISAGVSTMNLGPLLPSGRGKMLQNQVLTPAEYRRTLLTVLNFLDTLDGRSDAVRFSLVGDESLFARLFYELGRWNEYQETYGARPTHGVNSSGLGFAILPDGTVYPRRLIPVTIGRLPGDSFQKIYEKSAELLRSLDEDYIENKKKASAKCRTCPVLDYCTKCGTSYIASGSPYGPNPGCWVE
ncbi:MAG: radical SAM protein [Planctomycetes bacterium]|nr:radical SAM protein [Planctomycetota bacterium]